MCLNIMQNHWDKQSFLHLNTRNFFKKSQWLLFGIYLFFNIFLFLKPYQIIYKGKFLILFLYKNFVKNIVFH